MAMQGLAAGFCGFGGFAGGVDIGDIFGDLFGEMFQHGRCERNSAALASMRGDDLRFDLTIDFEDAIFGAETDAKLRRLRGLHDLQGIGERIGPRAERLRPLPRARTDPLSAGILLCGADVRCMQRHRADDQRSLPDVPRRGRTAPEENRLKVKVPPGVEEGTRIRYSGEGDAGRAGGPKGDLYVVLSIRRHEFFERQGQNLHCVIPISFPQAALGAEFEIAGIDGPVMIKVPEGTQSGKELRIRGKGVPHLNEKGRGDLIVRLSCRSRAS